MTTMTKAQALKDFKEQIKNDSRMKDDRIMKAEAWNDYTDMLCKDGIITQKQYDNWVNPF